MIVYFSGSARELEKDAPVFREIIQCLQDHGAVIANSWFEGAALRGVLPQSMERWREIVSEAAMGIRDADVVIVEGSGRSGFGVGFELAEALRLEKSTILLISDTERDNSYAAGLEQTRLRVVFYSRKDIKINLSRELADVRIREAS